MSTHTISISLEQVENHSDIVAQCNPLFFLKDEVSDVYIILNLKCDFIRSDFLALIVAAIRNLDERGINISGEITANGLNVGYAQRMDFFEIIRVPYKEEFIRHHHNNRFLEITQIEPNDFIVVDRISAMLIANASLDVETVSILDLALGELVDNIRHSQSFNGGWAVSQYIHGNNQIKAIVIDTGIGIVNSLTSSEEHKGLSPYEAMSNCIEKGVTRDKKSGRGNGLHIVSEFIKKNGGIMKLHSGDIKHSIAQGRSIVSSSEYWEGTYIYLEINTKVKVEITDIMKDESHYNVFCEKHGLEQLW
jgi:anti-sigma regulatory factor (Ser/Thr protein kinase)